MTVRVLVVEDEARVADAHASYVERVPGFVVAGIAHSAAETMRLLDSERGRWLGERLPLEPRVVLDDDEPLTSRRIRRALGPELRREALPNE